MKIGVLGGSFNPIHNGHIKIAQDAIDQLKLDKLMLVPTGIATHREPVDIMHRLKMCEIACEEFGFVLCRYEVDKDTCSYTYETLQYLNETYQNAQLFLIIGGDQYENFCTWKNPNVIQNLAKIVVASRKGYSGSESAIFLNNDYIDISSSMLRDMVNKGDDISQYVPKSIMDYIKKEGLYKI